MTEQQEQYTELEKEAQKWLDETDTMQFSQMELLTMFAAKKVKDYDLLHSVIVPKGTLCISCQKEPATNGIGNRKTLCSKCWNKIAG